MEEPVAKEPRIRHSQVFGAVVDRGPSTVRDLTKLLYPDGTRGRGSRQGEWVEKDPGTVQRKLDALVGARLLTVTQEERPESETGSRALVTVESDLARAWVIYYGADTVYAGIYNATGRPVRYIDSDEIEQHALRMSNDLSPIARQKNLPSVLKKGVELLAGLIAAAGSAALPADGCTARVAVAIGLPAALDHAGQRVVSEDPKGWQDRHERRRTIEDILASHWSRMQARYGGAFPPLPVGPTSAGSESVALIVETDVVLDVLGAMRDPRSAPPAAKDAKLDANHLRSASVVLGIKHSSGIRSTLLTRGDDDLSVQTPRLPGQRRDMIFRGAFGDTLGLGHSIALVHRAAEQVPDDLDPFRNLAEWSRTAEARCSCGAHGPAHLQGVASPRAVLHRLGLERDGSDPIAVWRRIAEATEAQDELGRRAELVLRETGRVMAYAIDTGVRLYDPEVVLVTGSLPFNDVLWTTLTDESDVSNSERRSLVRASDLQNDDPHEPIGPRGAAWLALDSWVMPALVRDCDRIIDVTSR